MKSFSPTLAPPEIRSKLKAERLKVEGFNHSLCRLTIFGQMFLRHVARKILEQAANQNQLLSRICPGFGVWSGGMISSPVVK